MKKAFTMVELVFVVMIIGIMSAVLAPRADNNSLQQATNQIISHIRYTQHLALTDDKFSNTIQNWFRRRWQIVFYKSSGTNNGNWVYTIYSDNNMDGTIDRDEIAKNPDHVNKFLTGFYSNANTKVQKSSYTKNMDIEKSFGITDIIFAGGCSNNAHSISFDRIGRPFIGLTSNQASAYQNGRLMTNQCQITFKANEDNITIAIEPETGYVHQL
jgi:prepilin-type N-terminal cleavage/methylation domain-containing protein